MFQASGFLLDPRIAFLRMFGGRSKLFDWDILTCRVRDKLLPHSPMGISYFVYSVPQKCGVGLFDMFDRRVM